VGDIDGRNMDDVEGAKVGCLLENLRGCGCGIGGDDEDGDMERVVCEEALAKLHHGNYVPHAGTSQKNCMWF